MGCASLTRQIANSGYVPEALEAPENRCARNAVKINGTRDSIRSRVRGFARTDRWNSLCTCQQEVQNEELSWSVLAF